MTTKVLDTLSPEYFKDFSCIGSDCEETCCAGWQVMIDEETYKKYKKVKDPKMKSSLAKTIIRNRTNPTKTEAAEIKMKGTKCPLLSEEGWCTVHLKLGEDYLSNTCATYPRIHNKVNEVIERSLTVSCPEAARLVLLNEKGINFVQDQEELSIRQLLGIASTSKAEVTRWSDFFDEYRHLTIFILQDRNYTLQERLLILGLLYNELEQCIHSKKLSEIPNILGNYLKCIEDHTFKGAFDEIPKRVDIQVRLCRELVVLRLQYGVTSARYLECSRDMMSGLKIEGDSTDQQIVEYYEAAYSEHYAPFMKDHEYMLENYLVNYVFKNCLPIDCATPFESFTRLTLNYALIKIHLVGMSKEHGGLTPELVVKLVHSLSKTFEHNPGYFEQIMKAIKANNLMKLEYMSILINN